MGWVRTIVDRVSGKAVPEGFTGELDREENVLACATVRSGGHLVATSQGLWVPEAEGSRRIGWHLISKATWANNLLNVIEARVSGEAGEAVLLVDLPAHRFQLTEPGKVPQIVHARVTGSIRSRHRREFTGGGAWFVQRKVPGRDGVVLQVRPDDGADVAEISTVAAVVAESIRTAIESHGS